MIQHCVLMRVKSALTQADKQVLFDSVAGLQSLVPGIVSIKHGANVSPEGLSGGFHDGFIVTFETPDARDAYLVHPDHMVVGEKIVAACDGGLSGILVFDLAV